ncbi:helix-turn-helix domain-containing protein [Microbispora bryophytorum]|uniref:Uncharacterized protein n=1 Tax=Microbispora bryophytorum TaxID=1460882 RepID=A0A8H9GUA1_9ACTN|nr:hypothetical protein [Microbispora bryophytorum]MBD3135523.1 hypothetical protein [Microbispora bryophytorum]GGN98088.1 hypothetical protein GCM10011574_02320 [Microbispora bryophytorum]
MRSRRISATVSAIISGSASGCWAVVAARIVRTARANLFDKLAVTNRVQVAIAAYRAGLVD